MEKRTILLPESHEDITLDQYQKYRALCQRENLKPAEFIKRKLMIFTGLKYHEIEKVELSDYTNLLEWVDKALEDEGKFKPIFELQGIEFGFIPNFDEIQAKEYFDLSMYNKKEVAEENLHKTMAILFRPVIATDLLGNYEVAPYNGTALYSELMKQVPMSQVVSALFFFRTLRLKLSKHILTSLEVESRKEGASQSFSRSGVGTQRFTKWRKEKFGNTNLSKIWRYIAS